MLTTGALSITLRHTDVDAGGTLSGQIVCHQPVPSGVIRLELQHTDRTHGTPWTLQSTSAVLPPGQRSIGVGIDFDYQVPEWVPPSFTGQTLRHDWTLVASIDGAPPVSVDIRINPAPADVQPGRRNSAEAEWRYQREHQEQLERRQAPPHLRWDAGDSLIVILAVLAESALGLVTPTVAVVATLVIIWIRKGYRRTPDRRHDIGVSGLGGVVDTGQQLTFEVTNNEGGELIATLRCTEWCMTYRDGGGSATPSVVYEQTAIVQAPAHVVMEVPSDALPSVKIGPSAVHWHLAVHHPGDTHNAAMYPVTVIARTLPAAVPTARTADASQRPIALDTSPTHTAIERSAGIVASFVVAAVLVVAGLIAVGLYLLESAWTETGGDDVEQSLTVELRRNGSAIPQATLDDQQHLVMTITERDAAALAIGTTTHPFDAFTADRVPGSGGNQVCDSWWLQVMARMLSPGAVSVSRVG